MPQCLAFWPFGHFSALCWWLLDTVGLVQISTEHHLWEEAEGGYTGVKSKEVEESMGSGLQ